MKLVVINECTDLVVLDRNEQMYIFYDKLKKDTKEIIAFGNPGYDIKFHYLNKDEKDAPYMIELKGVCLFNVDYTIQIKEEKK